LVSSRNVLENNRGGCIALSGEIEMWDVTVLLAVSEEIEMWEVTALL
jgi:hypothetical protein